MAMVVITLGMTDLLFALDSIPAIYGLTQEPYLVLTANVFALMGLRQLYFLIGGLLKRLVYLSYGLAFLLLFIGVKLILHAMHENELPFINGGEHIGWAPEIPIWLSLLVILGTLVVTAVASLMSDKSKKRPGQAVHRIPHVSWSPASRATSAHDWCRGCSTTATASACSPATGARSRRASGATGSRSWRATRRRPRPSARALDGVDVGLLPAALDGRTPRVRRARPRPRHDVRPARPHERGVGRIVYMSGLHPHDGELSEHLASRVEVGELLMGSGVPDRRAAGRGDRRLRLGVVRDAAPPDPPAAGDAHAEVARQPDPADRACATCCTTSWPPRTCRPRSTAPSTSVVPTC